MVFRLDKALFILVTNLQRLETLERPSELGLSFQLGGGAVYFLASENIPSSSEMGSIAVIRGGTF